MASFSRALVNMATVVAVCVAMVLLSMGPMVMADLAEECRKGCRPGCQLIAPAACMSIVQTAPLLKLTCEDRFRGLCEILCQNFCTANTLPPAGSPICLL
ncbi:hypothetical protein HU200_048699 [Digitaria exilis]|uniref:Uncharacterized protein n=1 Tax=Digitaria exilis TaxID=1010633 RepID=A0A835ARW2_9POAL|nr:hypothetical protein HU200_048699 [Digitaria exilis]